MKASDDVSSERIVKIFEAAQRASLLPEAYMKQIRIEFPDLTRECALKLLKEGARANLPAPEKVQ